MHAENAKKITTAQEKEREVTYFDAKPDEQTNERVSELKRKRREREKKEI